MFRIKTFDQVNDSAQNAFCREKYAVSDIQSEPHALVIGSEELHEQDIPESVIAIARAGIDVSNLPVEECSEKGIVIFNTPGINANAIKELTVAAFVMASRKIAEAVSWVESLENQDNISEVVEEAKSDFSGTEILGKTAGVIGLGEVGVLVANTLIDLGMKVKVYDPSMSDGSEYSLSYLAEHASTLDEVFASCDYVTLHLPECGEFRNLIDEELLSKAKPGMKLVNLCCRELVASEAVIDALGKEIVETYVTDFPREEFIGNLSVVCMPHLGDCTSECEANSSVMACAQLKDFLENGNIKNSFNYPDCVMKRSQNNRICVLHLNMPSMIYRISSVFDENNININEMISGSKGVYSYTLIDVNEKTELVKEKICSMEGVISVRLIGAFAEQQSPC